MYSSWTTIQSFLADPGTGFPRDTIQQLLNSSESSTASCFAICQLSSPSTTQQLLAALKKSFFTAKISWQLISTRSWDKFIICQHLCIYKGAVCCHIEPGLHAVVNVTQNTQQNCALHDSGRYWTLVTGNPGRWNFYTKYLDKHDRIKHGYFKIKPFKWKKTICEPRPHLKSLYRLWQL